MFLIIKAINKLKSEAPAAPAEPSSTDKLLTEIRDALKK
jgi:large conductance mechanosensitive channel